MLRRAINDDRGKLRVGASCKVRCHQLVASSIMWHVCICCDQLIVCLYCIKHKPIVHGLLLVARGKVCE